LRHGHSSLAATRMVFSNHASALPLSVEMPSTVHFTGVGKNPEPIEECGCESEEEQEEDAVCSCSKAMKVLRCVTSGCSSGTCNCNNRTLVLACDDLANRCPKLQFSCSARKATCDAHEELEGPPLKTKNATKENATKEAEEMKEEENVTLEIEKEISYDEVYEELASLKEKKCKIQFAMNNGHKFHKKLKKVEEEINEKMEELNEAGQKLPEMHCYKHFEEWHEPKPSNKDNVTKSSSLFGAKSSAQNALLGATSYAALVAAATFAVAWN